MSSHRPLWASRARWRLYGAWRWPALAAFTLCDGLLLHLLPPSASGADLAAAIIVASFCNLFLVGAVAPWLARRIQARRRRAARIAPAGGAPSPADTGPPLEVVVDRTAIAVLAAGALGVLAAGLGSRPVIVSETRATEANARAVRAYVLAHGSEEQRRNLETANTHRLEEGLFRTCLATDDRRGASCFYVNTRVKPPHVRPDPSSETNEELFQPGRRR